MNDYDNELISAYIDGELTKTERQTFEQRLQNEPELRDELNALRQTIALIGQLPALKAPRNYTLTAEMVADVPARNTVSTPRNIIPLSFVSALSSAAAAILIIAGVILLITGGNDDALSTTQNAESAGVASAPTETATLSTAFTNLGELSTAERLTAVAGGDVDGVAPLQLTAPGQTGLRIAPTLQISPTALAGGAGATGGITADTALDEGEADDAIASAEEEASDGDTAPEADTFDNDTLELEAESAEDSDDSEVSAASAMMPSATATVSVSVIVPNAPVPTLFPTNGVPMTTQLPGALAQDTMAEDSVNSEPVPFNLPVPTDELTQIAAFSANDEALDDVADAESITGQDRQAQTESEADIIAPEEQRAVETIVTDDPADDRNTLGLVLIVVGLLTGSIALMTWWLPKRQGA